MNLNKEEQQFIADNITRYDVVTGITVDDIEVRIHYKEHGGTGSTAIYRTANIADIYAHAVAKTKRAKAQLPVEGSALVYRGFRGWTKA